LCLAAYLRERFDLDIRLIDQRVDNWTVDRLAREAVDFQADVAGFSCMTIFATLAREAVAKARQALPNALILVGGPHISAFGADALETIEADAGVVGEGERTFEQILAAYVAGADFDSIPGLVWRNKAGEVVTNPGAMPLLEALDALPFPAYDLLDVRKNWKYQRFSSVPPAPYVSLMSSRGCPYQCIYCHGIFGKRTRFQSAERIVAEMEHFGRTLGVKEFEFFDDVFNLDPERVVAFGDLVRKKGLKPRIDFPNALRADILTEETIDALVAAGTYHSAFALESGSPRIQKYIGKHLNIPRFLRNVELAVNRGIFAHGFTMMGFPTETEADLQMTLNVVCESKLHSATFFTVIPFPNTELYARVLQSHPEKLARVRYDGTEYTGARVNLSDVPDEVLFGYQRRAWRQFYLNPRRVARIVRDYPRRSYLPHFLPMYLLRITKGLFGQDSSA
jgi:radical SAM superfamily enzyme YgiQ (UPF0313 family)